jgi:hypothetical protein
MMDAKILRLQVMPAHHNWRQHAVHWAIKNIRSLLAEA